MLGHLDCGIPICELYWVQYKGLTRNIDTIMLLTVTVFRIDIEQNRRVWRAVVSPVFRRCVDGTCTAVQLATSVLYKRREGTNAIGEVGAYAIGRANAMWKGGKVKGNLNKTHTKGGRRWRAKDELWPITYRKKTMLGMKRDGTLVYGKNYTRQQRQHTML